jgi:hypothetical protein
VKPKERGIKGASTQAEQLVGQAFGMSPSSVHSVSGSIRHMRKLDPKSEAFPAVTLDEFDRWIADPFFATN